MTIVVKMRVLLVAAYSLEPTSFLIIKQIEVNVLVDESFYSKLGIRLKPRIQENWHKDGSLRRPHCQPFHSFGCNRRVGWT